MENRTLRWLLLRAVTPWYVVGVLAIPAYYAVIKFALAHYKLSGSTTIAPLPLAVIFFVFKQITNRAKKKADRVGQTAPPGLAHAAGLVKAVGVGGRAVVRVTVGRGGAVWLKVGAPLVLTLSGEHLRAVIAYHTAVLQMPNPKLAAKITARIQDLEVRKPEKAAWLRERVRPLLDELHAVGWSAMGASCPDPAAAWGHWADAATAFASMEARLDVRLAAGELPGAFLNDWARSVFRPHPAVPWLEADTDFWCSMDWLRGRPGAMKASSSGARIGDGQRSILTGVAGLAAVGVFVSVLTLVSKHNENRPDLVTTYVTGCVQKGSALRIEYRVVNNSSRQVSVVPSFSVDGEALSQASVAVVIPANASRDETATVAYEETAGDVPFCEVSATVQ